MEETLFTCAQYLTTAHREDTKEHRSKTYHNLVLRGKLRTAVRWIMERETGGHTSDHVGVHKYGGDSDGDAAHKICRGPPTNSGQPVLVPGPSIRTLPG